MNKTEILATQKTWGDFIVRLGQLADSQTSNKEIIAAALDGINLHYAYGHCEVIFKPTKATGSAAFRPSVDGAVSYFIGNRGQAGAVDGDHGFATDKPWKAVRFSADQQITEVTSGVIMAGGHYYFTDVSGQETEVEYTFTYKKVDGHWLIVGHHSSLPYKPDHK